MSLKESNRQHKQHIHWQTDAKKNVDSWWASTHISIGVPQMQEIIEIRPIHVSQHPITPQVRFLHNCPDKIWLMKKKFGQRRQVMIDLPRTGEKNEALGTKNTGDINLKWHQTWSASIVSIIIPLFHIWGIVILWFSIITKRNKNWMSYMLISLHTFTCKKRFVLETSSDLK